ncbi:uncharacterized protein TM35_000045470 [Trypanosoma theileri]|uniref:Uncharacterized protein n=1 Tax=Trypanosoma theileri TaxID=67003 RepID=A0A1X0P6R9_9TRYP|nr:uncharacterized protein TM35_000045470 [Trypanosoma theileri]ORC92333.1 hypothetical protein TM35_000045470 [Trypanosoma theileri]
MFSRGSLRAARSPIHRFERRIFRGTPTISRSTASFSQLSRESTRSTTTNTIPTTVASLSSSSSSLLEASLVRGDPHSIVAAFLQAEHRAEHGTLRRVLSCSASRDILLCACAAMVTPVASWPMFLTMRLKIPREGKDAALMSSSWRTFFLAVVKSILTSLDPSTGITKSKSVPNEYGSASIGLLCATCLAPTLKIGERFARASCEGGNETLSTSSKAATAAAMAYAACCSVVTSDTQDADTAWLRLWTTMKFVPDNVLDLGYIRCQELQICCLLRSEKYNEIEDLLLQSIATYALERMTDVTLAKLFLLDSLGSVARCRVLAALLEVTKGKYRVMEMGVALRLSPFERGRNLPSVTRSSILFAKVLRCLVAQAHDEPSIANSLRVLRDIEGLSRLSNSYALADSLVPHDATLESIMTASMNKQRARLVATLVESVSEVTDLACAVFRRVTSTCTVAASSTNDDNVDRESVEAALQGCVGVLTGLFTLCAGRRGELPKRRAEPEWRQRLQRATAVRSHKYELLCAELPHAQLSRCLATLLANGHLLVGGGLGYRLVTSDFVDLNFYSLGLLGLLYHATRVGQQQQQQMDASAVIQSLYQRRREVFGEDVAAPVLNICAAAGVNTTLRVCETALVQYESDAPSISLLHARSAVASGGSVVVDDSFGVWLRKATLTLSQ